MSKTDTTPIAERPKRRSLQKAAVDQYGTPEYWARLDAMTDDDIAAGILKDPIARPRTKEEIARARRISPAKFIRQKLGLSQDQFSETFRIPVGTLRDWEQHRREPDQAARAYLDVIAREPKAVQRALAQVDKDEATAKAKRESAKGRAKSPT